MPPNQAKTVITVPAFLSPDGSLLGKTAITIHFILFVKKKQKKLGTIIYRKGGNILQVLSFARHSLPDITEESQPQKGGTIFPDEQELATVEE